MTLSRRLRFEILRRDNHTCRYCGGTAPNVRLTVDHVLPIALGGGDEPTNLVAACADCNGGKSSTRVGEHVSQQVSDDAIRWAKAIAAAAEQVNAEIEEDAEDELPSDWYWIWSRCTFPSWNGTKYMADFPEDAARSLKMVRSRGMSTDTILAAAARSLTAEQVKPSEKFRYFMGICWRTIDEIEARAKELFDAQPSEG